jgi:DNA-binding response OmpR family regulator
MGKEQGGRRPFNLHFPAQKGCEKMNKALIIEDDSNISELERDYLEANNIVAKIVGDGALGLEMALEGDFDIVLLDIMLPKLNGFEICKKIREKKNIPILLVSAKKEDVDKIKGLGLGADDYIVKPFSPSELVARVKAHINRYNRLTSNQTDGDVLEIDGLKIDRLCATAQINEKQLSLTKKEFDVLFLLASSPDTIFTKEELFKSVWGYDSLGDTSTLTVHINRLREKIKDISPTSDFIKTIWSRGYRFR